jgi:muramoyltetrapeptide carboxypeptidase
VRTGLVGVHGELVTHGFGEWEGLESGRHQQYVDIYRRLLTSSGAPGPLPAGDGWEPWRQGRARGPLIGGLLNRLIRVQATPFAVPPERFEGAILFWEEIGASTAAIWNDLHVLRQAGLLERIAGMVVGTPTMVEATAGGPPELRDIVLEVLGDRDIPVLGNVDIGHAGPNLPMPLGLSAELDTGALSLTLLEPAVSG